tara:strand:- start:6238 stop:7287 length:1050 start_codon:yes stop_codon:yes gene_type:complete
VKSKKRILLAPLDWGIGHATRCVPIIKALIANNFTVVIAADGRPLHLLSKEFPKLEIIRLPGYNIKYSSYLAMSINILLQVPKIIWNIKKENTTLNDIIKDYKIDGVISDNRFGLHAIKIPCVFITHQLEIQSPYFTEKIQRFNYRYINRFNVCWVIDNKENNLAGKLSRPNILPNNTIYIGTQSRFKYEKMAKKYDFLAIVSGPETQRKILERGLTKALQSRTERSLIVLGKPELNNTSQIGNLTIKSHLGTEELNKVILQSKLIICRPGYSTIMDLEKLRSKAFFIPTPGQTEQEYLSKELYQKNICYYQNQNKFDFEKAIIESENYTGFSRPEKQIINWKKLFSLF